MLVYLTRQSTRKKKSTNKRRHTDTDTQTQTPTNTHRHTNRHTATGPVMDMCYLPVPHHDESMDVTAVTAAPVWVCVRCSSDGNPR